MTMNIGEAAVRSGVPAKTIRYYEQIGLLGSPARSENLYRSYDEDDAALLRFVGRARRLGFSIEELRSLVALYRDRSRSSRDVKALAKQHLADIDRKIHELQSLRHAMSELIERCQGDERPNCPILDELSGAGCAPERFRPPAARQRSSSVADAEPKERQLSAARDA
jgi:MerR family copper efflux transcriptional regulator